LFFSLFAFVISTERGVDGALRRPSRSKIITKYHTITMPFTNTRTLVHQDVEEATFASKTGKTLTTTKPNASSWGLGLRSCTNPYPTPE
jgi:hypothetical protein